MIEVMVLCYHAVSPTWNAALSVTPPALESQLAYLVRHGWRAVGFREAVLSPPHPRTLAITFDDAFGSVKDLALPVLASLGLPATVFVPTACIEGEQRLAWPGVDHWNETPFASELRSLSWDDLGCLADLGWEIGSHTRTHPNLTAVNDEELMVELAGSRQEIADRLGCAGDTIAYPYGDFDRRVVDGAERAGYVAAATLSRHPGLTGLHCWPRVGIYNRDAAWRFRLKVSRSVRDLNAPRLWAARS